MSTPPAYSVENDSSISFQRSGPAWIALLPLALLPAVAVLAGLGTALNLIFPIASLLVGLFLYFRYPVLYAGFTWWLWLISAFIRRLSDYRSSYTEPSILLLAPYLVTAITFITVIQQFPRIDRRLSLPFILPLLGIAYGFAIGLTRSDVALFTIVRELLDWLVPLSFGFHMMVNWRSFPMYYQNIRRTFVWGVLIVGSYGIFQFLVAPEWDTSWLINSGMITANGYHDTTFGPRAIRVFSTMQSVEPLGAFMAAALLFLFDYQGALRTPAAVVGYLTFLLTLMRAAWIGWLAGVFALLGLLPAKQQMRMVVVMMLMIVVILPLTVIEPFSTSLEDRFQSLSNINEDGSTQARQETYMEGIGKIMVNPIGEGIGQGMRDSAVLSLFLSLGWLGMLLYSCGLVLAISKTYQYSTSNHFTLFQAVARSIAVSCLIRMPFNGTAIVGIGGLILWSFLGLSIASGKYSRNSS